MSASDEALGGLRFRPRAVLMFAASGVLAVVALAVHSSVPLLLAVPLLLGPAAAATSSPRLPPSYRISWSSEGSRGAVEVTGRLDPTEGGSVHGLVPTFYRPEPLVDESPPEVRLDGEALTFHLHWSAPYPCLVSVSLPRVQWRDPLGLVERPVTVEGQALRLQRFPPELARASRAPLRRTTPLPGEVRARQLGGAGEFFAIRPLMASDTRRQVNWRASARAGRMLANDYRVERTGDLLIVLDLRPTSLGPEIDARLASVAAAGAYGLAQSFLEQKARVGLALYTDFVESIPLGSGRRQRFRLLRALQAARVGDTAGPSERLAVSLRRYFPPGVTTVLLSALADEESTLVLPHLRRRGFPAFVLSPSPVPLLGRLGSRPTEDDARALRLLRLVRRRRIAEAWSEAAVVEWDDYWSLASLASFFARAGGPEGGDVTPTLEHLVPGLDVRSLRAAAIVTTLAVLMGVVGGEPLVLAALAPIAGTVVSLAIRGRPLAGAREYGLAPALVAVGLVAALASPSLLVGLIAGVTGLGVLLWNAETPSESLRTVDPVEGLFVPGLGLTVALVTVIVLPAARDAVGIAAIAVVLALAMVVWALRGALVADAVPAKAL